MHIFITYLHFCKRERPEDDRICKIVKIKVHYPRLAQRRGTGEGELSLNASAVDRVLIEAYI